MKNKILVVIISLFNLVLNTLLYLFVMTAYFLHQYDEPDAHPPFGLTAEQFSDIFSSFSLILIFASIIWSLYSIFRIKQIKTALIPTIMTIIVLLLVLSSKHNYQVISESKFPKDEFYYWIQERKYKNETKVYRWKKPLDKKGYTLEFKEAPWLFDTIIIVKD